MGLSELFGHVKGAFTGATSNRMGRFAEANGGTLLVDEVADLPLDGQARLLRVLQERELSPVGSNEVIRIDVRLVCATNKNLSAEAAAGRFRYDLLDWFKAMTIALPPLRDRTGDVRLLIDHFARGAFADLKIPPKTISPEGD